MHAQFGAARQWAGAQEQRYFLLCCSAAPRASMSLRQCTDFYRRRRHGFPDFWGLRLTLSLGKVLLIEGVDIDELAAQLTAQLASGNPQLTEGRVPMIVAGQ
jgi:hypothetical protein